MEFIKLNNDRYMIKDGNSRVVSKEDKLKLEKKELIIEDISSNNCQGETTKKIAEIDKELEDKTNGNIEQTRKTAKGHKESK